MSEKNARETGFPSAGTPAAAILKAHRPEPDYEHPRGDMTGRWAQPAFRPVIHTHRLVLRPLTGIDLAGIVAAVGDYEVSKMLARVPHPYTFGNGAGFVDWARRRAAAGGGLICAVTRRERFIGVVSLDALPARNRLGYWLGREHWGRGYATEAVRALVAYAFEELGLPLIRSGVFADNPASLRILRKVGFRPVGRRSSLSLARNQRLEHVATVLTRARYLGRRR